MKLFTSLSVCILLIDKQFPSFLENPHRGFPYQYPDYRCFVGNRSRYDLNAKMHWGKAGRTHWHRVRLQPSKQSVQLPCKCNSILKQGGWGSYQHGLPRLSVLMNLPGNRITVHKGWWPKRGHFGVHLMGAWQSFKKFQMNYFFSLSLLIIDQTWLCMWAH